MSKNNKTGDKLIRTEEDKLISEYSLDLIFCFLNEIISDCYNAEASRQNVGISYFALIQQCPYNEFQHPKP